MMAAPNRKDKEVMHKINISYLGFSYQNHDPGTNMVNFNQKKKLLGQNLVLVICKYVNHFEITGYNRRSSLYKNFTYTYLFDGKTGGLHSYLIAKVLPSFEIGRAHV